MAAKIVLTVKSKFHDIEVYGVMFRCTPGGEVWKERCGGKWELVSNNKPNGNGYISVKTNGKSMLLHRIIFAAFNNSFDIYDSSIQIDHINRIKTDNRIDNLRMATNAENNQNKTRRSDNSSGQKNIYAFYRRERDHWYWRVEIIHNGNKHQKYFFADRGPVPDLLPPIPQDVIDYRDDMLIQLHGEYACFG